MFYLYLADVSVPLLGTRQIMQKLGYGPDKRLALKVSTRNIPPYRDPAVILTDQLKGDARRPGYRIGVRC
jgi:peptide/nickel transport system substrate-binding protein